MEIAIAEKRDWERLYKFYKKVYRVNHPLHNQDFWNWQFSDERYGRSFFAAKEDGEVVGHVAANFGGGYAWMINAYLNEEFRGQGVLAKLYSMARHFYPLAASSANPAGLGLYRNMSWYRYCDLQRYVLINPRFSKITLKELLAPLTLTHELQKPGGHFWEQPFMLSHTFKDGSTGIVQLNNGGIRVVDLENVNEFVDEVWQLGYRWLDYISSWNDKKLRLLEQKGWVLDYQSVIPWRLDPVVEGEMAMVTYLSEDMVPRDFIVHRSYSDHGRVGSIKSKATE